MGVISKTVRILTRGRTRDSRRKPPRTQARDAEVRRKVAEEQAAAIAKALHEDDAQAKADLEAVARKEAEALPWSPPDDY